MNFTMADIDRLSRKVPNICKVAPSSHYHVEDVHRAGGIFTILGELDRAGLIHRSASDRPRQHASARPSTQTTSGAPRPRLARAKGARGAPAGVRTQVAFSQDTYFDVDRRRRRKGLHPRLRTRLRARRRACGPARQHRRRWMHRKTAGVDQSCCLLRRPRAGLPFARGCVRSHPGRSNRPRRRRRHRLRGPARRTGHAGNARIRPHFLKGKGLGKAARSSRTAASAAGPRCSASDTCRPKPRKAGRSP